MYKGGQGPSYQELQRRRHLDQKKQAESYCRELDDYLESGEELQTRIHEQYVNERSSHRHDPCKNGKHKTSAASQSKSAPASNTEKQAITTTCTSSSASFTEKRASNHRTTRSNKFQRSLQVAKSCRAAFSVVDATTIDRHHQQVTLVHTAGNVYNVTISTTPQCDGCKYCSARDICSHIIWVLLYVCNIKESSDLLHQRLFLKSELETIIKEVPVDASTATFPGSQASSAASSNTGDQLWKIGSVSSKGKLPHCCKCSRQFQREEVSIQVSAKWKSPNKTADGEDLKLDRKFHFCLKWACVNQRPQNSNLKTPPKDIILDGDVGAHLTAEDYQAIFSENLPVKWLSYK